LRTLQAARDEAGAAARSADRDAWPEPSVGIQVTRESYVRNPPETQILGVLSVPISLFQRNQGARATAEAQSRIADAERDSFGSQLLNLIEQHRSAVVAAAGQVRTYGREILPTFEENLSLIQRAFELGEIDILQVSVARERFLRIQTDALDAYANYFQAVADLEVSIGTDLWRDDYHEQTTP
jgi:cobalt-zinc-cadmium efflux system outer membrane protein